MKQIKQIRRGVFLVLQILVLIFFNEFASSADRFADVIIERSEQMKNSERSMKVIKQSIAVSDFERAEKYSLFLQNWASTMVNFFPEGSGASISNTSAASNDIWKDFTVFRHLVELKKEASDRMVSASRREDKRELIRAYEATEKICIKCHEAFRN